MTKVSSPRLILVKTFNWWRLDLCAIYDIVYSNAQIQPPTIEINKEIALYNNLDLQDKFQQCSLRYRCPESNICVPPTCSEF